jgi:hypothetical protein
MKAKAATVYLIGDNACYHAYYEGEYPIFEVVILFRHLRAFSKTYLYVSLFKIEERIEIPAKAFTRLLPS